MALEDDGREHSHESDVLTVKVPPIFTSYCKAIKDEVRARYNLPENHDIQIVYALGLWKACWWEPRKWYHIFKQDCNVRIMAKSLPYLLDEVRCSHPHTACSWH